jgi:hypothetical protein
MSNLKELLERAFAFDYNEARAEFERRDAYCEDTGFTHGAEWQNLTQVPLAKEIIAELVEAIKKHHKVWGHNDLCFSECNELCQALAKVEARLKQTHGAEG